MTHTIGLPDDVWGRLASEADERGCTTADLLRVAILGLIQPGNSTDRVLQMVRAGFVDAEISLSVGLSKDRVGQIRRDAGLTRNIDRHWRTRWATGNRFSNPARARNQPGHPTTHTQETNKPTEAHSEGAS